MMPQPPTDLRRRIRKEIADIAPFDDLEKSAQAKALTWIDSGAEVFRIKKPDLPPKHLVAYFLLVDGDYILLVDHRNAGLWLPSGGHVEPGEHPQTTVEREIVEELGITATFALKGAQFITITQTVGQTAQHTDVSLWYVVKGDRHQTLNFDKNEFDQIHWFHRTAPPAERVEPHLARFLQKLPMC